MTKVYHWSPTGMEDFFSENIKDECGSDYLCNHYVSFEDYDDLVIQNARLANEVTRAGEYVWLIEANQTYWAGTSLDVSAFCDDPNQAVRFARFEDAERVKQWLLKPHAFALRSTQHAFIKVNPCINLPCVLPKGHYGNCVVCLGDLLRTLRKEGR